MLAQTRLSTEKILQDQVKAMDQGRETTRTNIAAILETVSRIEKATPQTSLLNDALGGTSKQQKSARRNGETSLQNDNSLLEIVGNLLTRVKEEFAVVHIKQDVFKSTMNAFSSQISSVPANYAEIFRRLHRVEERGDNIYGKVAEMAVADQQILENFLSTQGDIKELSQDIFQRLADIDNDSCSRENKMSGRLVENHNRITELTNNFDNWTSPETQYNLLASINSMPQQLTDLNLLTQNTGVQIRELIANNSQLEGKFHVGAEQFKELTQLNTRLEEKLDRLLSLQRQPHHSRAEAQLVLSCGNLAAVEKIIDFQTTW